MFYVVVTDTRGNKWFTNLCSNMVSDCKDMIIHMFTASKCVRISVYSEAFYINVSHIVHAHIEYRNEK